MEKIEAILELLWIVLRPVVVGAVATELIHGRDKGFWHSFGVGVFGALLGEWLMPKIGLDFPSFINAVIGAVILVSVFEL